MEEIALVTDWRPEWDPKGYWMSEKLDGIRAYWDGKQLYSKHGVVLEAPSFWKGNLPQVTLDGELWMGRKKFQKIMGIRNVRDEDTWKSIVSNK